MRTVERGHVHPLVSRRASRGSGVLGTSLGLFVFLLTMFVAVQVAYALYARSMLTNAAHDAARHVAGYGAAADRDAARATEEARFHDRFGGLDERDAALVWAADDPDVVAVRVTARLPSLLPLGLSDAFGVGSTDREVRVRVERER